jgi:arylsulfatase
MESPSLAEVLKAEGYATGHYGKNHLGDRNEHLPTVHGFDEFFGNL